MAVSSVIDDCCERLHRAIKNPFSTVSSRWKRVRYWRHKNQCWYAYLFAYFSAPLESCSTFVDSCSHPAFRISPCISPESDGVRWSLFHSDFIRVYLIHVAEWFFLFDTYEQLTVASRRKFFEKGCIISESSYCAHYLQNTWICAQAVHQPWVFNWSSHPSHNECSWLISLHFA